MVNAGGDQSAVGEECSTNRDKNGYTRKGDKVGMTSKPKKRESSGMMQLNGWFFV